MRIPRTVTPLLMTCCVVAVVSLLAAPAGAVQLHGDEGGVAPALGGVLDMRADREEPIDPDDSPVADRQAVVVFATGTSAPETPNAAEVVVAERLESIGSVDVVALAELAIDQVISADALVISAATDSGDLPPYLLKANVPIVAMKPANWNALGLVPPNEDSSTPLQKISRISIESAHQIASEAGSALELFADGEAWSVGRGWELPDALTGDDAPTVIATGSGGAAVIAFDAGDQLGWPYRDASDTAPACRVAFPAHSSADAVLSEEGLSLLEASVAWAVGESCATNRPVPATPSLDSTMCRAEVADETMRATNGELVERADDEEPNLSALWVRALEYVDVDGTPTAFVGGRFQVAHDAVAERDEDGSLGDGYLRPGVFGCDLSSGTVTAFRAPISVDSMTPVGNGVSNERVRALAFDGTWLYIGGKFTLDEALLADLDLDQFRLDSTLALIRVDPLTGDIDTTWRPDIRGSVSAMVVDGDWLYVGGGVRQADGEAATRLIRVGIGADDDGRADPDFRPLIEATVPIGNAEPFATVLALEIVDDVLYLGGSFQSVDGEPRNSIAALTTETGLVTDFAPSLGDNNFGVDEIAQIKDIVAGVDGAIYACGDWWLTAEAPGLNWTAYDVDNDVEDPNEPSWFGQRSRVQPRPNQFNLGKFDGSTGASFVDENGVPWGPVTDGGVQACDYDAVTDTLLIGGHYERIGPFDQAFIDDGGPADDGDYPAAHQAYEKVTAIDGTTGQVLPWDPDVDSIRGLDAVRIIPAADGETSEILVGGAITESDRLARESLARYIWRR